MSQHFSVLVVCAYLLSPLGFALKAHDPLTEGEVIRLLQKGVLPERVGKLAQESGITFKVTPAVESDLRDSGANEELLETLRNVAARGQTTVTPRKPAQAPTAPPVAVPLNMTECEADQKCAAWTFLGKVGNGQGPSGEIEALSLENVSADTVLIRRADTTGSTGGLTAVYKGTRHGDRIAGEFTSSWPGHWSSKSGNWYATIGKPPQTLPNIIRTCATPGGTCWTWTWNHGHYDGFSSDARNASMVIDSFTPDSVVMRVSIPALCTTDCRYTCVEKGRIASEGNRIIDGEVRDSEGDTYRFNAAWGDAIPNLHAP